jgi:hypothetical protein
MQLIGMSSLGSFFVASENETETGNLLGAVLQVPDARNFNGSLLLVSVLNQAIRVDRPRADWRERGSEACPIWAATVLARHPRVLRVDASFRSRTQIASSIFKTAATSKAALRLAPAVGSDDFRQADVCITLANPRSNCRNHPNPRVSGSSA